MSEIFNSLYDEIFLNNNEVSLDSSNLGEITRKYLSSGVNAEDKSYFLKLRKEYLKIKRINNYDTLEKKLYQNKSRKQIISFELTRMINTKRLNLEQVANVGKLLEMSTDEISDDLYNKMVSLIIEVEISLGMKIGLFNELCTIFENKVEEIEKDLNMSSSMSNKRK